MKGKDCNKKCVEHTRQELLEKKRFEAWGIELPADLTSAEKSMIEDPVLDICDALAYAAMLIKSMRDAKNKDDFHFVPYMCLEDLKKFRDASP